LGGLGHTYASLGEYEKAVFYLKKALKISKKLKDLKLEADILSSMGMTYLRQKKYGKAKKNFLQEEKIWRKKGYQISRGAMAEYYLTLKNYKKALSLLRQDLKQGFFVDSLFSRAPYSFEFNLHYGLALRGMGRLFEASENLCWAVEWVEKARFKIKKRVQFFTTGAYGGYIRAYRALVSVLVERILKGENQHHLFAAYGKDLTCAAFYFSEATKARILLEAMAESVKKLETVELPPELRLKEENILGQLAAVENIWEIAPARGKKTLIDIEFKKGALQKEFEDFIAQLRRDYPKYASLNYPQPLPAEQILLKDDEILLEYMLSDDTSYLFKLKKGGVEKIIKIPESKEEIEKMVGEFLVSLADRTDGAVPSESNFPLKKGRFLYDLLLSGAIKGEPRDTKIIIVPDGILGRLPFEALVIYSDKDLRETVFVADKWKITYYQSATVLTLNRLRKPPSITRDFLGIANPIFNKNDPRYTQKPASDLADSNIPKTAFRGLVSIGGDGNKILNYLPLPETEKEIQVIARFFQSPKILLGKYANERWLHRVNPRFYRFIHIATHADLAGKIQGINEPFILLGQVENGPQRNGILTLTKVLNLCFDAELVVLSACATGIGKEIEGEGLLNFARAFHYAGARSILVSLWKIGSKETVEFMELFYEYLIKEQKSKAEALSLTRQQIKQKYPHPFFWSAFVLHGEG
jgi:CHAT domain-containing protein